MTKPLPYPFKAGIKRDGTVTEGDFHTDGRWCRFTALGKPRKIGGYRLMGQSMNGPVYGMHAYPNNAAIYVYTAFSNGIQMQVFDLNTGDVAGAISSRTPSGFINSADNICQFDNMFNPGGAGGLLFAHSAPNMVNIASSTAVPLFFGSLTDTTALTANTAPQVSGGVCVLHPYVFVYGDDGRISWSGAGTPDTWTGGDSGSARVAGSKIVKGVSIRASDGNAPAGIFFSLDSVIRATYIGGTAIFNFNTIAEDVSPMSSRAIVNVDGTIYWVASDRFMMYNGTVKEIPNQLDLEFFFSNLKPANRQKCWALKVPRWGEVWFCFPFGNDSNATYCVIHNYRIGTWYDTILPEVGRSDGWYPTYFLYPIMAGLDPNSSNAYPLWQHEYRTGATDVFDRIANGQTDAISSYITTGDISLTDAGKNLNATLDRIELDMNQTGDMTIQTHTRPYPRAQDNQGKMCTVKSSDTVCDELRTEGRFVRTTFASNVAGGSFEFGQPIFQIGEGTGRPAGA